MIDAPIFCRFKGGPCTNKDCLPGKQSGKPETLLPRCEHSLATILDEALSTPETQIDLEELVNRLSIEEHVVHIPEGKMVEVFDATLEAVRNHRKALADWANY